MNKLSEKQREKITKYLSQPQELIERTRDEMTSVFQFNKKELLTEDQLERSRKDGIENYINPLNKSAEETLLSKKESITNALTREVIICSKKSIKEYIKKYQISLPESFLENIEINTVQGLLQKANCDAKALLGEIIYGPENVESVDRNVQFCFFTHELVHVISKKDYKVLKKGNSISRSGSSGYVNRLHTGKGIGAFINEGFTDLIAFNICKENGVDVTLPRTKVYSKSLYLIDKIINHLSKGNKEQYKKIMDYLIRGNLLGDMRYMRIVKDTLGAEFTRELGQLSFGDIPGVITFMEKYPKIFGEKKISPHIQEYIGTINREYPFDEETLEKGK